MGWFSPPSRREISLVLFSLTVFIFSYNLDITLSPHNTVFRKLGLASSSVIAKDGRRPAGWRDRLENVIFGEWRWDEGHVAGDGAERVREKGTDRYGAQWLGQRETGIVGGDIFGRTTADDAVQRWEDDVPTTTMVKHVPGYTIFDDVIIFDGSLFLVTDNRTGFPPLSSIITKSNSVTGMDIEILSQEQARYRLGTFGGKIGGVTFLSNDATPHNSTLISLWRMYSSLDSSIDASGYTTLVPPIRLFFPHITAFSDPPPHPDNPDFVRVRSLTGIHPYLAKAAFPTLEIMYKKDWQDYHSMGVPFILERVVIADRGAAGRSNRNPPFSPPFESLSTSKYWLEPIRRTLTTYLDISEDSRRRKKPVVTYLSRQEETVGLRLKAADHEELVKELTKAGRRFGYEIIVVSEKTMWEHRMAAIVRSTVVLGAHGDHLTDAIFVKPSPHTTFVEFFPDGTFMRNYELLARAVGTQYLAVWNNQIFREGSLPNNSELNINQEISVNAKAVVRAIREALQG